MEPYVMAFGAFLLVAGTLFAVFGIPYYVAATFGSDSMTGAIDSAILIAAIGAAVLAYGVASKSKKETSTESQH
ncbi:MAG: hypothetical protein ABSB53_07915 [Nitrososphaerales archaeon]|jgi:Zn-dependent protease